MNSQPGMSDSCNHPQTKVDERPKFDNAVHSRKYKIIRPRKSRKKTRFL